MASGVFADLQRILSAIQIPQLRKNGDVFQQRIGEIFDLLGIPRLFYGVGYAEGKLLKPAVEAGVKHVTDQIQQVAQLSAKRDAAKSTHAAIDRNLYLREFLAAEGEQTQARFWEWVAAESTQIMAEMALNPTEVAKSLEYAEGFIKHHIASTPLVASQHRSLFFACVVLAWGTIEVLSGDVWELTVNLRSRTVGLNAWRDKPLSTELLRKYDLNLQGKIGTILKEKEAVSFKKVSSIRSAFQLISPDLRAHTTSPAYVVNLDNALDVNRGSPIIQVEQARHLIVHSHGVIDQSYLNETGHNYNIGDPLPLDLSMVLRHLGVIATVGTKIIDFVHTFLLSTSDHIG